MADLLIELFSEEIPARMQVKAAADLQRLMTDGLVDAGLTYAGAAAFATPRRLTLALEGLSNASPTLREERRGPRTDAPEKALDGFLRSTGLTRDQLEARDEKKGSFWYATVETPGREAPVIIAEVLEKTIRAFPWPKAMRWGSGTLRWVRPLHSVLCLLTDDAGEASIVPFEIDGIVSTDMTSGHRFMHPMRFTVSSFEDYAAKLKRAHVILSSSERAEMIWNDATQQAFALGLEIVEDKGLLAEVAGLVEWPVVLMGEIDEAFRDLPAEVLQTSMKEHQKFFSVKDKDGRIVRFVTVANRETADDGATILKGNQKVLFARLSDAKFFWENDLRIAEAGMAPWVDALSNVTFHNKLGSQADRINRVAGLARKVALLTRADADHAETAARLAKADLSSEMVYEFPELQGIMGSYYALRAGHPDDVAAVASEHYQPLGPSEPVPTAPLSVTVALADKIDTLAGFWAIDEKPTGSKDPFALRRAALGVIRLILENDLRGALLDVFQTHLETLKTTVTIDQSQDSEVVKSINPVNISEDLLGFTHDRLKVYLRDRGIRHDVIDACLAMPNADDLTLLVKRAEALQAVLDTEDGENLVQGFKRAHNILTQAEEKDGVEYSFGPDRKFADAAEEIALFDALDAAEAKIAPAMASEDFKTAMEAMATLRGPIDAFFEAVQVNAESGAIRRNRLNLLHRISSTCRSVADLTRIEG